jgi:uncharacterized protein involved in exopolysaccharide biosynthesis
MTANNMRNPSGDRHPADSPRPVPAYLVPAPDSHDGTGSPGFWAVIMDHRKTVVATTLLGAIIAAVIAFMLTPIYRAEVLLSPVTESNGRGDLHGLTTQLDSIVTLTGIGMEGDTQKDEAVATLKSRAFTTQFIRDEKLLPVLFDKYWDSGNGRWKQYSGKTPPTYWEGFEFFDEKVRHVTESRKTGLVTLAIEWKDRELAARWANALVQRVNRHLRARAIEEAEKSLAYLNEELGKTSIVELQKAIYRLIEDQVSRIMLANVREEYSFKVIDPAVAPDADDFVRPRRGLIVGLGLGWGLLLGMGLAFLARAVRARKASA